MSNFGESPKVTKEQVQTYENIRQSGVINMWDAKTGCELSHGKLNKDNWLYIINNYIDLIEHYNIDRD